MAFAALLAALGLLFCVIDWRRGLLACIAIGYLQDPLRKIVPGQPVAFVVLVGVFFVGCAIGFLVEQGPRAVGDFFGWHPSLRVPIGVFVAVVLAQSGVTFLKTHSPVLAGIGLLSYLSPVVALLLGHRFCVTLRSVGHWQKVYLAGALVVGASILLDFVGLDSVLFKSIGDSTVFGRGGRIEMISGLMRSSETAAWHAATAACLVVIWSVSRRRTRAFWVGAATTLALLLAVVLTGRRKTLGEALLFLIVFGFLLARSRLGASRLFRIGGGLAFGGAALVLILSSRGGGQTWNPYFERSFSVVSDASDRLERMASIEQLYFVVLENGFFGSGAGTGAQGAQYFGGGTKLVGHGSEGGLGRLTAELGVPGLLIALWSAMFVLKRLWRLGRVLSRAAPQYAVRCCGLIALVPANAVVFLTAHQVFGDPFVLITLGLVTSSALAFPQIILRESQMETARPAVAPPVLRRIPA